MEANQRFIRLSEDAVNPESKSEDTRLRFVAIEDVKIPSIWSKNGTEAAKRKMADMVARTDNALNRFGEQLSKGLNDLGRQLNSAVDPSYDPNKVWNGSYPNQQSTNEKVNQEVDGQESIYDSEFKAGKPFENTTNTEFNKDKEIDDNSISKIRTGVGINLDNNDLLTFLGFEKAGLISVNSFYTKFDKRIADGAELKLECYNIFPFDITLHKGDIIGYGVIQNIKCSCNDNKTIDTEIDGQINLDKEQI